MYSLSSSKLLVVTKSKLSSICQQGLVKAGLETTTLPSLSVLLPGDALLAISLRTGCPGPVPTHVNHSFGLSGLLETDTDAPKQEIGRLTCCTRSRSYPWKGSLTALGTLLSMLGSSAEPQPSALWRTADWARREWLQFCPSVTLCTLTFTLGFGLGNMPFPLGS